MKSPIWWESPRTSDAILAQPKGAICTEECTQGCKTKQTSAPRMAPKPREPPQRAWMQMLKGPAAPHLPLCHSYHAHSPEDKPSALLFRTEQHQVVLMMSVWGGAFYPTWTCASKSGPWQILLDGVFLAILPAQCVQVRNTILDILLNLATRLQVC